MEDKRIKEVEKELKQLGCGEVELEGDFGIKSIEGDLFSKEFTRYTQDAATTFVAVAKSSYGSIVLGKEESTQFLKFSVQLLRIVFSTLFNKDALSLLVRTIRILKRKR